MLCLIVPHLDIFVYKLSPLIESMNLIIRRLADSKVGTIFTHEFSIQSF